MHFIPLCPFEPFDEMKQAKTLQQYFMQCAFNEALIAWINGEIPVGAVAVIDNQIVARNHNKVEAKQDATAHAEMELIHTLSGQQHDWRLINITFYITKEPCPMCSGAIYKARVPRVVIGAHDHLQGCLGGRIHFNQILKLHHQITVLTEPLEGACKSLLDTFFKLRRKEK